MHTNIASCRSNKKWELHTGQHSVNTLKPNMVSHKQTKLFCMPLNLLVFISIYFYLCFKIIIINNFNTTQDQFILPAPPVGGLPISQDRLDNMKPVHDRTIPIILPSGNILADTMFKINIWYTNPGTSALT